MLISREGLLIISLVFVSVGCFGQQQRIFDVIDPNFQNSDIRYYQTKDLLGNPYYFEDWKSGKLYMKGGQIFSDLKMNIDCLKDQVHIIQQGTVQPMVVQKSKIDRVVFFDGINQTIFAVVNHQKETRLMVQLVAGKVQLHKRVVKEIRAAPPMSDTGYGNAAKDRIVQEEQYYFQIEDEIKKISSKKDELIAELESYNYQIEGFLKNNKKLNLKKEADLVLLFEHLNTIN